MDIITTLHPETNTGDDLYPNIKSANIPNSAISSEKIANGAITRNKLYNHLYQHVISCSWQQFNFTFIIILPNSIQYTNLSKFISYIYNIYSDNFRITVAGTYNNSCAAYIHFISSSVGRLFYHVSDGKLNYVDTTSDVIIKDNIVEIY